MTSLIPCPNCDKSVDPQARTCANCGVDLAISAVLAEREVKLPSQFPDGVPMVPEILVPRIGDYLIEKKYLKPDELDQALAYQKEKAACGESLLLGQALRKLDFIDAETLDQAITVQIAQLHTALSQSNRQLEKRVQERTVELQNALNKLTELNQLKANFIANITHELRTPLTHIKGYLDILAAGGLGPLTPEQSDALEVLLRAEARLESLIEDLIQFSIASRAQLRLNKERVDLGKLIETTVNQSTDKAKRSEVIIGIRVPEKLTFVYCDKEKIGWVIDQFLDNAIKFSPEGGRVVVEANQGDGWVDLAVTDTGIGIPSDRFDEIFEPFHQLDGASTRRYSGTGLGLALCNRIIEAHGAEIKVRSKMGKGSSFEFSLSPVEDVEE